MDREVSPDSEYPIDAANRTGLGAGFGGTHPVRIHLGADAVTRWHRLVNPQVASNSPSMRPFLWSTLVVALCLATSRSNIGVGIVSDGGNTTDETTESVTPAQSKMEPTESLTPTERLWADQMDECVGLTDFDTLVVRRSTIVDVLALSDANIQVVQDPQVWVVAFETHAGVEVLNDAAARRAYREVMTSTRNADSTSGAGMPPNATAASSVRQSSIAPTTGYCAFGFNENSGMHWWVVVPPEKADAFMAAFRRLPRTP